MSFSFSLVGFHGPSDHRSLTDHLRCKSHKNNLTCLNSRESNCTGLPVFPQPISYLYRQNNRKTFLQGQISCLHLLAIHLANWLPVWKSFAWKVINVPVIHFVMGISSFLPPWNNLSWLTKNANTSKLTLSIRPTHSYRQVSITVWKPVNIELQVCIIEIHQHDKSVLTHVNRSC